jgi:aminoglycoside phosphotransferase (APT) family kinase protein
VTPDRKRLIADALGRTPRTILEIDDGYDFEVAIVDDEWVFRFPRRSGVEEALELEIATLPAIAPALRVDVPSFDFVSCDPLFVGYRLIRGEPLVDEDAEGVRAFLGALHALDLSALPVEHPDWVESYRAQCAEFERLVLPLSKKTSAHRRSDYSARRRRWGTSSRRSSTPTSVLSICSCATIAWPA